MAGYSYVIKNGTIIDGSGFPMTRGDLGISGGIIKQIGELRGSEGATRVIDASGKYIMPGVIDITNHSDTHWTIFNYPSQESMLAQGITTIVGGACGSSLAPLTDIRAIRSIQKWIDISNINVNWKSLSEFFEEMSKHALGVNFATLVGHGTLRRDISGDEARELTKNELDAMRLLLRKSLDEGAFGVSFGLAMSHGRTVGQDELLQLARVVKESEKIVSIHLRNEGRRLLSSVVEAVAIARSSGASVHISHFKAIGRKAWHDLHKALLIIRKARKEEGIDITVDFFPYVRTGSLLYTLLPEWILEGGREKILGVLQDQSKRSMIIDSIKNLTLHYENITIAEARKDKNVIGKTITQISEMVGLSPEETFIHLLIANELGVTIFGKTLASANILSIAKEDYAMFSSDGVGDDHTVKRRTPDLAHPRSYGAAPRFLGRIARRKKALPWEDAVKKMTSMPARRLGLGESRGLLRKGYAADIVIFDPDIVDGMATYADPYQLPVGIDYVFVNGNCAVEKGVFTGSLAGKILRRV